MRLGIKWREKAFTYIVLLAPFLGQSAGSNEREPEGVSVVAGVVALASSPSNEEPLFYRNAVTCRVS
jgi:hypothetical protein